MRDKKVVILGDGSAKFQALSPKINAYFIPSPSHPEASNMCALAWEKYKAKDFESVAYFEPFYLKEFQTTPSKKSI